MYVCVFILTAFVSFPLHNVVFESTILASCSYLLLPPNQLAALALRVKTENVRYAS